MRIVEPGHVYVVDNADVRDGEQQGQTIRFVRRRGPDGELLAPADRGAGMLTQELLRVAIDRTLYLYAEAPCEEDTQIVEHLRAALTLYESRAARRAIEKLSKPEQAPLCGICHHILCGHGQGSSA